MQVSVAATADASGLTKKHFQVTAQLAAAQHGIATAQRVTAWEQALSMSTATHCGLAPPQHSIPVAYTLMFCLSLATSACCTGAEGGPCCV